MEIDFNNFRKQICYNHNRLVNLLNGCLIDENTELKMYSDDVGELSVILDRFRTEIAFLKCLIDDEKGEFDYIDVELENFKTNEKTTI